MHDCNKHGAFLFIPIYGWIVLPLNKGSSGPNRYDPGEEEQELDEHTAEAESGISQKRDIPSGICKQCNEQVTGNFCQNCGSPVYMEIIDQHYFVNEMKGILGLQGCFFSSIKKLLVFPGISARQYIKNNRNNFVRPLVYLFFTALLYTPVDLIDDYYDDARAVVNDLQFHEGAQMSIEPSAEATAIGITKANFPIIDGSTSTLPLFQEIIRTMYAENRRYYPRRASRTVPSYELLINGEVDMILVPEPSEFVLALAENAGVELEFVEVAAEALVFITADENPVSNITREQVLQIYTDRSITNWTQLGGNDGQIIPLNRNTHSGSQTLMDNLVLQGEEVHPDLSQYSIGMMSDMLWEAGGSSWRRRDDPNNFALGYTVYFFLQSDYINESDLKLLSFDGVAPSRETIISGEYPLSTNYFAVLRKDTPQNHPARAIVNWLLSPAGQDAVEASGLGKIK
jgi:phosphate transport system substrate-binding protein